MATKSKLKDTAIKVDEHTWYYEERRGICVVREVMDREGEHTKTEQFYIPWVKLRASLKRKDCK